MPSALGQWEAGVRVNERSPRWQEEQQPQEGIWKMLLFFLSFFPFRQPLFLYSQGENSQEFSPTFSERIFIAGSKQYR